MDEFSSLLGGVQEDLPLDVSGSLEFIDELPVAGEEAWKVLRDLPVRSLDPGRDAAVIANVAGGVLPQDEQDGFDNRRFQPGINYDPGESVRGASRIVARIATPDAPYTEGESEEIIRSPGYREANKPGPFSMSNPVYASRVYFSEADRVKICADRKRRREILASKGLLGRFSPPKRFNPYSKVRCD